MSWPRPPFASVSAKPYWASSGTPQKSMCGSQSARWRQAVASASSSSSSRRSWTSIAYRGSCGNSRASSLQTASAAVGQSGRTESRCRSRCRRPESTGGGLTIDRHHAQAARRPVEIGALAQNGLPALIPTDRQVCLARAVRQDLVSGEPLLDDRQQIERNAGRERMQRGGGSKVRANDRKEILRLRKARAERSWALTTPCAPIHSGDRRA